jgi:hypothetical protein
MAEVNIFADFVQVKGRSKRLFFNVFLGGIVRFRDAVSGSVEAKELIR